MYMLCNSLLIDYRLCASGGSFDVSRLVYVRWPVNLTVKVRRQSVGSELICSTNLIILLEKL